MTSCFSRFTLIAAMGVYWAGFFKVLLFSTLLFLDRFFISPLGLRHDEGETQKYRQTNPNHQLQGKRSGTCSSDKIAKGTGQRTREDNQRNISHPSSVRNIPCFVSLSVFCIHWSVFYTVHTEGNTNTTVSCFLVDHGHL